MFCTDWGKQLQDGDLYCLYCETKTDYTEKVMQILEGYCSKVYICHCKK